jgi:predicted ATPase/DNA-binding SARP family transcriptional activator
VAGAVEVRLLGPTRVLVDGAPVALGGPRQAAVFTYLALRAPHPVAADTLIADVWGARPPATARKTLQKYISELRAALGPAGGVLASDGGYALRVEADRIDTGRFERLVREAVAARRSGDAARATARLSEARALWTGRPLETVEDGVAPELPARLEELRLVAVEEEVEARLDLGDHGLLVAELEELTERHPLRERLWAGLLVALYRSGRQAEALRAYQRLRRRLADELGLEPSAPLRTLEQRILAQDPTLGLPAPPATNLPQPATRLIGRTGELAEVERLVTDERLVTLVGPGGVGKTRLALAVAGGLLDRYTPGGGVWFVDLGTVDDADRVMAAVAAVLRLPDLADQPLAQVVVSFVRAKHLLLVLDTCEHLRAGVAGLVRDLLAVAPHLHVLATSRAALRVPGERVVEVEPLRVPPPSPALAPTLSALREVASVQLVEERARAAATGFVLDHANAADVARLCRRLDGIPLALELAAARLRVFAPGELADVVTRDPGLIGWTDGTGTGAGAERHATLDAAIEWSYRLLTGPERLLFTRATVHRGNFTLAACADIAADPALPRDRVPELVAGLVDKSMIVARRGPDGEIRFRMLDTVREFGQRLLTAEELAQVRATHARHYADIVEQLATAGSPGAREVVFGQIEPAYENVRAALEHLLTGGEQRAALRMAIGLAPFWDSVGHRTDGQEYLLQALATATEAPDVGDHDRAEALVAASSLFQTADLARSAELAARAAELAEALGDPVLLTQALRWWGWAKVMARDLDGAPLLERATALARQVGDRGEEGMCLAGLGALASIEGDGTPHYEAAVAVLRQLGDQRRLTNVLYLWATRALKPRGKFDRAEVVYRESLAIAERLGSRHDRAHAYSELGQVARLRGDDARALPILTESAALFDEIADRRCIARIGGALGALALRRGDLGEAHRRLAGSLATALEVDEKPAIAAGAEGLAELALRCHRPDDAARLAGYARAVRERHTILAPGVEGTTRAVLWAELAAGLGRERLDELAAEGARAGPADITGWAGASSAGTA